MIDAFSRAQALIADKMRQGGRVIVALEGHAATGKTTLAARLAKAFPAVVIPMDDFFLPPALRTPERFAQPGGNIDYERFAREVAAPLKTGAPFSYRAYDCHAGVFSGEKRVDAERVVLVEGVYSLHPAYRDIYSLRLLLTASEKTRDDRLRARGEGLYARFQSFWLPMEDAFYAAYPPEEICDAVLTT